MALHSMIAIPKPVACPKCGGSDFAGVGKREFYSLGADRKKDAPSSIIYTFKCHCGHLWGVEVKKSAEEAR